MIIIITATGPIASLSTVFEGLLNDIEAEVRAAAASHLSDVCSFLPKSFVISKVLVITIITIIIIMI